MERLFGTSGSPFMHQLSIDDRAPTWFFIQGSLTRVVRTLPRLWVIGTIAAALSVAACKQTEAPPAPPALDQIAQSAEPRRDLPEEQRSPDLFGAWLVQAVSTPEAALQDRSWDMVLLVGVRQLELLSQCVTIGPFDYGRTVGGGIAVRQSSVAPRPGPAAPAPVQCARTLSPAERAIPPILLASSEVRRRSDGSVVLSGGAGALTVRRPSGALRNPRGASPPPRVPPALGAWRFVKVDGRTIAPAHTMELLLRPKHLEWRSGCVSEVKTLGREADTLVLSDSDAFPVCERGRSEAERLAERLFSGKVAFRMGAEGRLRLRGSGVTAELDPLVR